MNELDIRLQEIEARLLSLELHRERVIRSLGDGITAPSVLAGDDSPGELELAAANAKLSNLKAWCRCPTEGTQYYWRVLDGDHGWACLQCKKVTQMG